MTKNVDSESNISVSLPNIKEKPIKINRRVVSPNTAGDMSSDHRSIPPHGPNLHDTMVSGDTSGT